MDMRMLESSRYTRDKVLGLLEEHLTGGRSRPDRPDPQGPRAKRDPRDSTLAATEMADVQQAWRKADLDPVERAALAWWIAGWTHGDIGRAFQTNARGGRYLVDCAIKAMLNMLNETKA